MTGNGKNWGNDQFDTTTTVTLTHGRTQGSFTATATTGEAMSGTFKCGDHILSD